MIEILSNIWTNQLNLKINYVIKFDSLLLCYPLELPIGPGWVYPQGL